MSDPSITPGVRFKEYEIVERLGAGGMGEVYLAHDLRLDRQVALKVLRGDQGERDRIERFASEARAASALNHPNLAAIYGIGQQGPYYFIAMEYVSGETLRKVTLRADEILEAAIQIADALQAAHEAGIIHRDIKPANIMRTGSGLIKVLDFGLAKRMSPTVPTPALTQPGMVVGTLGYMSPEQLLGRQLDHRTDIFSLGVVLHELLTGRLPFEAESYQGALALMMAKSSDPAMPRRAALDDIIKKCIRRDPDQRYQTAAELGKALREARSSSVVRRSRREWIAAVGMTAAGAGFAAWRVRDWTLRPAPHNSVAILPFTAEGAAGDIQYLCEGIAESLMNRLASVAGLHVMSRDSAFRHKGQPATEAGKQLAVRTVVTGAIRRLGESLLLVSAEFIDVARGERLWGDEFRGNDQDVLAFRDNIAASIARHLEVELAGIGTPPLPRETQDPKAHDLYLRGRFHASQPDDKALQAGINYLQKAVALDADYALAHAGLAEAHLLASDWLVPGSVAYPKARQAAQTALDCDPDLADAYVVRGMVRLCADLDWQGAEADFRKTKELNPNLAVSYAWLGWVLSVTGRGREGLAASQRATELEVRSPLNHTLLSVNLYFCGDYAGSFDAAGRALEIDPHFPLALHWQGLSAIAKGLPKLAAERLETARKADGGPMIMAALGRAYAAEGETEKARRILAELTALSQSQYVSPILLAGLHAALKEDHAALDRLENAYQARARLLLWTKLDPAYVRIRGMARFQALIARLKLPA